jgi:K+-transporting ATPase KdpF subunit
VFDGRRHCRDLRPVRFHITDRLRQRLRESVKIMFDLVFGGIISVALLVYLTWALVRPEDF